jgi:hypothetical protein
VRRGAANAAQHSDTPYAMLMNLGGLTPQAEALFGSALKPVRDAGARDG